MIDKNDQAAYIKYLEERLEKLTKNSSIGDSDLNTLIDTQNEVIINNAYSFKKSLSENRHLLEQLDELQKRNDMSDAFIEYLMNSFWWKITQPLRFVSRRLKNHQHYSQFDFSNIETIKDSVSVIIYVTSTDDNLSHQIKNLRKQTGFHHLKISLVDLTNSEAIAKIATSFAATYINLASTGDDLTLAKNLSSNKNKYTVYLSQGVYLDAPDWLYKMVRPLSEKYALASVLYSRRTSMIERVKTETFFNELRSRIIKLGQYECMYLPANRNGVQYIPPIVMNDLSAIAKRRS